MTNSEAPGEAADSGDAAGSAGSVDAGGFADSGDAAGTDSNGGVGGTGSGDGYGGTGSPGQPPPTDCILDTYEASCDGCLRHNCRRPCPEVSVASLYQDCMTACGDDACEAHCESNWPSGPSTLAELKECEAVYCGDACLVKYNCADHLDDGADAQGACNTCLLAGCTVECEDAANEPSLADYLDCVRQCVDADCPDTCDSQYPEAAALVQWLEACMNVSCGPACIGT